MSDKSELEKIKIVYEDDDVLVIDKPSGWLVHAVDGENDESISTVVDWFLQRNPEVETVGESQNDAKGRAIVRSGVVHRLDRDTSGLLLLVKKQEAFGFIKQQFHDRLANKEYRAFVYGAVRDKWGTIERPIGRSAKDGRLRSAQRGARGTLRSAVTEWECIGTGRVEDELFSYLALKPLTGRTHQLRVHLKAIDRPIVGDRLYAPGQVDSSCNLGFARLALHAHRLEINLPSGKEGRFIAPLPDIFESAADSIATGQ